MIALKSFLVSKLTAFVKTRKEHNNYLKNKYGIVQQ